MINHAPGRPAGSHRLLRASRLLSAAVLWLVVGREAVGAAERDGRWAILVAGVSGDSQLQKQFYDELRTLRDLLVGRLSFPADQVFVLADDPAREPGLVQVRSTRDGLERVVRDVASRASKEDQVLIFIEGHGSFDNGTYKLNLVGPDPTGREMAALFDLIPTDRVVILNATPCSGGGIADLSRPGRVVVAATRSGSEKNRTRIGSHLIEAFGGAADADHNGRVSILEAYLFARQKVEQYYSAEGNLQTEHAVLDDDADGLGHDMPGPDNGEGLIARTTYLDRGIPAGARTAGQETLARQARELERKIEELRYSKPRMAESEYEKQLEELLVKLAEINGRLRQKP